MNNLSYTDELNALEISKEQYLIYGSGPLAVRGLRENNDIDILVTEKVWKELIKKHPTLDSIGIDDVPRKYIKIGHIEIDSLLGAYNIDVEKLFDDADIINGYRFMNLEDLLKYKIYLGRKKDLEDIEKIQKFLGR